MKKITVASLNPVKSNCTLRAFELVFPNENFEVMGVESPSGVSNQPIGENETLEGAMNRLGFIQQNESQADYWVAIEGGVRKSDHRYEAFAWVVISNGNQIGKAQTATFELPKPINDLLDKGIELGHADDMIFKRTHSKKGNGAVGILSNNLIDRTEYYEHAAILALIPFLNSQLYQNG